MKCAYISENRENDLHSRSFFINAGFALYRSDGTLLCRKMERQENDKSTKANGGYVKGRADVPAEIFRNCFEHNQGRIAGAHKKHIHASAGYIPK